jgi:hypothetical protein
LSNLQPARRSRKAPPQPIDSRTVEILGHAYFARRGYRILVSPYDPVGYDLVTERDDVFCRVQIKRASPRADRVRCYEIAKPGANRKVKDPDLYLVWLPRERQFIELPGNFLKGRSSRVIPIATYQNLEELTQ